MANRFGASPLPRRSLPGMLAIYLAAIASGQAFAQNAPADNATTPEPRWPDEKQVGVFSCHADHSLASYRALLISLHGLQFDLQRTLEIPAPRQTVHLFLFEREQTYQAYVRRYFPEAPARRALFIKESRGPGMVFAATGPQIGVDLRHEGAHALLHSSLPLVPLWLDEGLAEYFEVLPDLRRNNEPHLSKVRRAVRLRRHQDIRQLEAVRDLRQMGKTEYRYAWAWVHFMLHGPLPARQELKAYLGDIHSHTPPGVLSDRLQRRVPNLQSEFIRHFDDWGG